MNVLTSVAPPGFRSIRLERVSPARNEARFYIIVWQATLLEAGAVVRMWGRKGVSTRIASPLPFSDLDAAWPVIRRIIHRRLQRNYRIVRIQTTHSQET